MIIEIDTSQPNSLNWKAKGSERIVQNVINLINTFQYEIAYDRTIGINPKISDKPSDISASLYISEIYRVINDYEPRVIVKEVKITKVDENGDMQFKVVIEI